MLHVFCSTWVLMKANVVVVKTVQKNLVIIAVSASIQNLHQIVSSSKSIIRPWIACRLQFWKWSQKMIFRWKLGNPPISIVGRLPFSSLVSSILYECRPMSPYKICQTLACKKPSFLERFLEFFFSAHSHKQWWCFHQICLSSERLWQSKNTLT